VDCVQRGWHSAWSFEYRESGVQSRFGSIVLIVVGVLFLLSNLHVFSFHLVNNVLRTWWPALLIVIGAWGLMGKGK
jgi:hypothetical protein